MVPAGPKPLPIRASESVTIAIFRAQNEYKIAVQTPEFVLLVSFPDFTPRMFRSGIEQPAKNLQNSRKRLIYKGFP